MTALPEGASSQPRTRGQLVTVVLVLSLALNVFFIGGLAYTKYSAEDMNPGRRFQALAAELNLTPDQRKAFRELGQTMREKGQTLREANRQVIGELWDELGKPQPDQAKLAQFMEAAGKNRHDFQAAVGNELRAFLAMLNPEQRHRFIEFAKHRQDAAANRMRRVLLP